MTRARGAWLWLLAVAFPPLLLLTVITAWAVDVPFMDDWALVDDLDRWQRGEERLEHLFRGHDVHRILVPRLVMLSLAELSGWDLRWQMGLSILVATALAATLARVGPGTGRRPDWPWLAALSLVVFNLNQWENWCWGWQLQIVLAVAASAAALVVLDRAGHRPVGLVAAPLLGAVASYSFSSGLVVWPAAAPILLVAGLDGRDRWRRGLAWVVGAGLTVGSYLRGFRLGPEPIGPEPVGVLDLVAYALAYLGAPLAGSSLAVAVACGLVGAVAAVVGLGWMAAGRGELRRRAALWASLALIAVGSAALTASGRASLGLHQAISSRYVTVANLLWIALVAIGLEWWRRTPAAPRWARRVAVTAALGLLLALAAAEAARVGKVRRVFATLERGRAGLVAGDMERAGVLFPDRARLEQSAAVLRRLELSCFRPAAREAGGD